jgi:CRISPR/Cas system-associated protein Cas7 (RAMP superfamily)
MGGKREPEQRDKVLSAKEQQAALRRRREILDALMKVLRGS